MTDLVKCPKCQSTQITAQQKGYSVGKAAAGVVLTGGIGLLAGLHGSTNIDALCLNCGAKWSPKKLEEERAKMKADRMSKEKSEWVKEFMYAYQSNDMDKAYAIAEYRRGALLKEKGIIGVYQQLQSEQNLELIVKVILLGLFAAMFIWFLSCIS
jgi:predicted Zn-ribbon and HTH transcriptional regulator